MIRVFAHDVSDQFDDCRRQTKQYSCTRAAKANPTVALSIVRAWVDFAVARGVSKKVLLERCELDIWEPTRAPERTRKQVSDPLLQLERRVPFAQYLALIRAARELCAQPALALHFGESLDCVEYSLVSMLSRACATVQEALVQRNRYGRLMGDIEHTGTDRFELKHWGDKVWLIDTRANPNQCPELTESNFAQFAFRIRQMRQKPLLQAVHFSHPEPAYRAEYDRIFQVPLTFDSGQNAMLIDASWLHYKIALFPSYVFGILSVHAQAMLDELDRVKTMRGQVEKLLMPILHTGNTSMDSTAASLALSRQTLFRKLKLEGVTYEKILDELRHKLALNYLSGKKVSVNETAYLLGFADPAPFSRAFKRWTGCSPGRWANNPE